MCLRASVARFVAQCTQRVSCVGLLILFFAVQILQTNGYQDVDEYAPTGICRWTGSLYASMRGVGMKPVTVDQCIARNLAYGSHRFMGYWSRRSTAPARQECDYKRECPLGNWRACYGSRASGRGCVSIATWWSQKREAGSPYTAEKRLGIDECIGRILILMGWVILHRC